MPTGTLAFRHIPIFLAHGTRDEKVPIGLGRQAREVWKSSRAENMDWVEEVGLGHWCSPDILAKMVEFTGRGAASGGNGVG